MAFAAGRDGRNPIDRLSKWRKDCHGNCVTFSERRAGGIPAGGVDAVTPLERGSPNPTMIRTVLFAAAVLVAGPAFAHHPIGDETPASFADGVLSGIGHPMLGLDHLAFLLAMGLVAAILGRVWTGPLAFLGASAVGVLATASGLGSPLVEPAVALSLLAVGALALRGRALGAGPTLGLFALAGAAHGMAFGGAIVGAEATPLFAYLLGLAMIQYALAAGAGLLAMRLGGEQGQGAMPTRLAGAVAAGVGVAILFEMAEGLALGLMS